MTPIDLSTLSDSELEALVAEHVAGFHSIQNNRFNSGLAGFHAGDFENLVGIPRYLTDANACLALLEKYVWTVERSHDKYFLVIHGNDSSIIIRRGNEATFQRAAVFALLRSVPGQVR